jgi:hypothetical protein
MDEVEVDCGDNSCKSVSVRMAQANATDSDGNPVTPETAAERVLKILKDARRAPGNPAKGGRQPLGVVIRTDLELSGLRGKPVLLSWSMWESKGASQLFGDWLNTNFAYRILATTEHDSVSLDMWIPLPHRHGSYFVRTALTINDADLASADSDTFD